MASLNLCQFIGNIGKIETRYLSNGDAVTNCSIAVNETWKDQNGDKQERCEWVSITAYKKLAEIMQSYCIKGMQIYVSGKMQTQKRNRALYDGHYCNGYENAWRQKRQRRK